MPLFKRTRLAAAAFLVFLTGCDRSDAPATSPPPASAQHAPADVRTQATPPATEPTVERKFPEDLTIDPARDPRVREKAKAMNAIPVAGMKDLKVGDEVVVLVRADKGGGPIYGSGPYTIDSQLRKAVIHNGALNDRELGLVRVKVVKFDGEHISEPRNGVTPTKYGTYHTSYTIERVEVP